MSAFEKELLRTLKDIIQIVNESEGVAGYHLNGEVAEWAWFDCIVRADSLIEKCEAKGSQIPQANAINKVLAIMKRLLVLVVKVAMSRYASNVSKKD